MPRRRTTVKPVISAFIGGVLLAIGIDPGQMIFDAAVSTSGIYLRFIAIALFMIAIFLSFDWLVDVFKRSRSAYRRVGVLGVMSILLAFSAGFLVFQWEMAAIALLAATILWILARII